MLRGERHAAKDRTSFTTALSRAAVSDSAKDLVADREAYLAGLSAMKVALYPTAISTLKARTRAGIAPWCPWLTQGKWMRLGPFLSPFLIGQNSYSHQLDIAV